MIEWSVVGLLAWLVLSLVVALVVGGATQTAERRRRRVLADLFDARRCDVEDEAADIVAVR